MLRAFHTFTRAARLALSISIFLFAVASVGFLSGCSDQSGEQASSPPDGPPDQVLRDADESTWMQAARAGTLGAFTDYLQNFPNGKHAAEARERIAALTAQARNDAEERAWAAAMQADTTAAYADYLRDFPQGAHAAQARARQAALDQAAGREADEKSWAEALRFGSQVSLREYLRQFPNGAHAAEARQRLAALEQQARREADENAGSAAEVKADTGNEKRDAASKPKRASSRSATTGAGSQQGYRSSPTTSNPSLRSFWQRLFPQPSK